jgi:hypothetical protein
MNHVEESAELNRLLRIAVVCCVTGLCCVLLFLWRGFSAWSVGVGVFFGAPLLLVGVVLYTIAVVRDLRKRGAL